MSHYNYYRNFETLFRALPLLKQRINNVKSSCSSPASYGPAPILARTKRLPHPGSCATSVLRMRSSNWVRLRTVSCTIFTKPATFTLPRLTPKLLLIHLWKRWPVAVRLLLPIFLCIAKSAAAQASFSTVFSRSFGGTGIEDRLSPQLARDLGGRGLARSREFSWRRHVDQIVALACDLRRDL